MNRSKDNLQYWIAFLQDQQKRGNTPELSGKQKTGIPNFLQVGMAALTVPWYEGLKIHLCTSYDLAPGDDQKLSAELQNRFPQNDGNMFIVTSASHFSGFIVTCLKRVYTPGDYHDIAVPFLLTSSEKRLFDDRVFQEMQHLLFPFNDGGQCDTKPLESLRGVLGELVPLSSFALRFFTGTGHDHLAVGIRQSESIIA